MSDDRCRAVFHHRCTKRQGHGGAHHSGDSAELLDQLRGAVALDDDLFADLGKRAKRHNTDRAGFLRWVLTGKEPRAEEQS
jgi:hypothetical protein